MKEEELEIIDVYKLLGETRYKIRIKGTKLVFNIHANTGEEAIRRVLSLIKKTGLTDTVIDKLRALREL